MTAEAEYSLNFSGKGQKFCLSLHYNGSNSSLLVNGVKIYRLKAKDPELKAYLLCLHLASDSMKKTRRHGYAYGFSVNYDGVGVDDILDWKYKSTTLFNFSTNPYFFYGTTFWMKDLSPSSGSFLIK